MYVFMAFWQVMAFQVIVDGQKIFSEPQQATASPVLAKHEACFFTVLKTWL